MIDFTGQISVFMQRMYNANNNMKTRAANALLINDKK